MNKCNVCQKPCKNRCSRCQQTYYCSKACQKQDYKDHKEICVTQQPNVRVIVPNFKREYAEKYPREKSQIQLLARVQGNLQFNEDSIDKILQFNDNKIRRWRSWSKELSDFLSSPRQIGDIFARTTPIPYFSDTGSCALSFSNTHKQSLSLNQGKVHVAVGFVDLDLLLQATIVQSEDSTEQANKFIGYEGSVYAVAKTNVIVEMMMGKAPVRSIIEVWFSTVWTIETLKYFETAAKNVLQFENAPNDKPPNPTKKELHPEVRSLISHWCQSVSSPKSRKNAHDLWASTFDRADSIFAIVPNLVEPRDRVQVARHILTGEFPLMNDQQSKNLVASITMFNCNDGISPHSTSEFMLHMMPMNAILPKYQRENTSFLDALYNFLEDAITKVCTWLSPPIEMMEIYLHFQMVTSDDSGLLNSIKQLNASTMSWSNICDYFPACDFHKLIKACSGSNTVHVMSSMNWVTEVFGGHITDYDDSRVRRKILIDARKMILESGPTIDSSGYFRYDQIFKHPHNISNVFLARRVKDNWQSHFFRGQAVDNVDVSFSQYAHTHRIHELLNISFRYNHLT
ncbi:hypothetical protein RclHR1_06750009 [Rhizophagus clarus]|uniref:MYND-type domain-containing protein n=1 Tax=Rhizophagus clarus TaxID=94130 RepID=A0A2Z6S6B3_9GLOM|nr:hypothetical protein RclHR1_06750009 [Rhizophagus clarus]